jgi:hypothetical protein
MRWIIGLRNDKFFYERELYPECDSHCEETKDCPHYEPIKGAQWVFVGNGIALSELLTTMSN